MPNNDYTAVCLLSDRSGSMNSIRSEAEGSINGFIDRQKAKPGKMTLRLIEFSNGTRVVNESKPIADVLPYRLSPSGGTALLDAMGEQMAAFSEELGKLPESEYPGVIVFAVMTDGEENSSREYRWEDVKAATERFQEAGWNVVYLGANQDAFKVGAQLGVHRSSTMSYSSSSRGITSTLDLLDNYVATASATPVSGIAPEFSDEDRESAEQD